MSTVDDCLMFCSELVWIKLTEHTMKHTLNRHEAAATVLFLSFYIFRFNFGNLGFWFPWSLVLLIVAVALFTYIALLLVWTPISDFNLSGTWKCNRKPIKKERKKIVIATLIPRSCQENLCITATTMFLLKFSKFSTTPYWDQLDCLFALLLPACALLQSCINSKALKYHRLLVCFFHFNWSSSNRFIRHKCALCLGISQQIVWHLGLVFSRVTNLCKTSI